MECITRLSLSIRQLSHQVREFFFFFFQECNCQISLIDFFFFFFFFLLKEICRQKSFLTLYNPQVTGSNPRGTANSCPLCTTTAPKWRNLFILNISSHPLAWQRTSSDGSRLLIIAVVAPRAFLRVITPAPEVDLCLITLAVWFFSVIALGHEDLFLYFVFLAGVCCGGLIYV